MWRKLSILKHQLHIKWLILTSKLKWLGIFFSPFKRPNVHLHIGKIIYGTPYFLPRRKYKTKDGTYKYRPKKIGFNFVELGWKTKWHEYDYRFEWEPLISFVFFKWQIALLFYSKEGKGHYWECWLAFSHTDKTKSVRERIKEARENFPCVWKKLDYNDTKVCYWDLSLKQKYL